MEKYNKGKIEWPHNIYSTVVDSVHNKNEIDCNTINRLHPLFPLPTHYHSLPGIIPSFEMSSPVPSPHVLDPPLVHTALAAKCKIVTITCVVHVYGTYL